VVGALAAIVLLAAVVLLLATTVVDDEWAAHGYADAKWESATRAKQAMKFFILKRVCRKVMLKSDWRNECCVMG